MPWKLNITRKVLLFLLAAGMLPLVVLGWAAFELSKNIVIAQAEGEYARLAGSLATYVHLYNDQVEDMAANIAGNEDISRALRQADTGAASSFDRLQMRVQMGRLLNSYVRVKGLVSIDLFSVGGEHFHVGETLNVAVQRPEAAKDLLDEALRARTPLLWRGVDDNLNINSAQKKVITASRAIQYFSPLTGRSEPAGVMVISLNDEIMRSFLSGVTLAQGVQILQVDRNGFVTLHSSPGRFGSRLPDGLVQLLRSEAPLNEFVLDGEPTLMNLQSDGDRGWLYAVLAPRKLLVEKINNLAFVTFGLILVGLAAIGLVTWYFVRVLVQPIRAVSSGFSQLQREPATRHAKLALGGQDAEIDELIRGYNNLLDALDAQRLTTEELRRSEAERDETETVLSTAMDAIDEAFAVFDAEDRLVFCNERFKTTYPGGADVMVPGVQYETILRHIALLGHYVGPADKFEKWIQRQIDQHRSGNRFSEEQLKDGRWLRIVERKTAQGQIVGFRVDITALKKAEAAAVAASHAKSSFLATMSHEIRTPMNAILGLLKLLETTPLTDRQQDYVVKTEGAARSLLGLLNDILDFSKVEAGKMSLDPYPFDLEELLRDLAVILSANVGNKELEVLFDIDEALPRSLVGDALRLQQVLINLGGNAIKFTSTGHVVIRIEQLQRGVQGSEEFADIRFSVQDTGIGIAPENQQHIFSGFSQAEASTTRRFGGTGLGLAICQRLVGLMGGALQLNSALGEGSVFGFTLRLALAPRESEPVARANIHAGVMLLVDDDARARQIHRRYLVSAGWEVIEAAASEEAYQLAEDRARSEQGPFTLFLVDWHMPGADGWDFVLRLRTLEARLQMERARVIMVTGHGRELLAKRTAHDQSMLDGLLVKPITAAMLQDAVNDTSSSAARLRQSLRAGSSKRRLHGIRILVVEDNLINQQVAEELLNGEGAMVSLAANGQQGFEAVAQARTPFDVVLMDIQMPIMDGYEATRAIRDQLGLHTLPIVAMTANAMDSDREAALAAGMNAHIGKPFDLNHLVRVVLELTGAVPRLDGPTDGSAPPTTPDDRQLPVAAVGGLNAGVDPWAESQGIDLAAAVERMGGDLQLYGRMVRELARSLDAAVGEAQAATQAADLAQLTRQLHTLKGLCATLGLKASADEFAHIEAECKRAPDMHAAAGLLQPVNDAIEKAIHATRALDAHLTHTEHAEQAHGGDATPAAEIAGSEQDLLENIAQMLALLDASDLAVLQCFAGARARFAAVAPDLTRQLDDALALLDLVRARELCEMIGQQGQQRTVGA